MCKSLSLDLEINLLAGSSFRPLYSNLFPHHRANQKPLKASETSFLSLRGLYAKMIIEGLANYRSWNSGDCFMLCSRMPVPNTLPLVVQGTTPLSIESQENSIGGCILVMVVSGLGRGIGRFTSVTRAPRRGICVVGEERLVSGEAVAFRDAPRCASAVGR